MDAGEKYSAPDADKVLLSIWNNTRHPVQYFRLFLCLRQVHEQNHFRSLLLLHNFLPYIQPFLSLIYFLEIAFFAFAAIFSGVRP